MVAAGFQDIDEAHNIVLNIGMGECYLVIVIKVVYANHFIATVQQADCSVHTDKTGRTGYKNTHGE